MEISQKIQNLKGLRKEKRSEAISNIAKSFFNFLKKAEYKRFNKNLFLSFIPEETNIRQKQRITKEVFKLLIEDNRIKPIREKKPFICLENKPLSSMDSGSYSGLMKKNGFKMCYFVYSWDENDKRPIKVKVGESEINEEVNFDYDFAEPRTHKNKNRIGVYSNSRLSVVKRTFYKDINLFEVV